MSFYDEHPRLKIFSSKQINGNLESLAPPSDAPWPEVEGCLTALCMARSGSTLLCRQLETLYEVGQMGEKLNPPKVKKRSAQEIVGSRAEPWFAYKCAVAGIVSAEWSGLVDAYLDKTVFVRLVRRDILSQAVSYAKASQTGQWHSHRKPPGDPVYDAEKITDCIRVIAVGVEQLRRYAEVTGRPETVLVYEDIATLGLAAAKKVGDVLGLPLRKLDNLSELLRPIEKMGDSMNDEWKDRYLKTLTPTVGAIIDEYVASIDHGAPVSWMKSTAAPHPSHLKKAMRRGREFDGVLAKLAPETAEVLRAAIDFLRDRYRRANCYVVDDGERSKVTVRFGGQKGVENAVFSLTAKGDEVTLTLSSTVPFEDPGNLLKERGDKATLPVTDASTVEQDAVVALIDHAARYAPTPFPAIGKGRVYVKSRTGEETTLAA